LTGFLFVGWAVPTGQAVFIEKPRMDTNPHEFVLMRVNWWFSANLDGQNKLNVNRT